MSLARISTSLPVTAGNCTARLARYRMAGGGRPGLLLALVCLLALCSAGPALAGEIFVNESCNIHDAITAANTDSPVGNCPAGSGADTIKTEGRFIPWGSVGLAIQGPLPPITSTIVIVIQSGAPGPGNQFIFFLQSAVNPVFDVAAGGHLTLDGVEIRANRIAGARGLVVRRGGRAELRRSYIDAVPAPCGGAIYNEGVLTISNSQIMRNAPSGFSGGEPWTPAPGATLIYNNGGSLIRNGIHTNVGPGELDSNGPACQTSGPAAAVSRPAPECELPPRLRVGDRAIRSGNLFSNVRREAGLGGQKIGKIGIGDVVDVIEGPIEVDDHNWYGVSSDEGLVGWVAEAPARGFNCGYYFRSFTDVLPPAAPEVPPERQTCDEAEDLKVGSFAIIAQGSFMNYRAGPSLDELRLGGLAPGSVLEVQDGPETADNYQWWKVRNPVRGIDGWVTGGAVIFGGQCVRWLLPFGAQETMEEDAEASSS